jgi:luciferase family oxidoreductase group 1
MGIVISVLDQSPIYPGDTAEEALARTIRLARKAEELGFRRFWVSEHHDTEHLAGSSPEVLISHLLARTESIRIGSGGIMIQHYSPYKVSENFHVLSALAPGRVDLGVGRAPGGLPRSTQALQKHAAAEQPTLTEKIEELAGYIGGAPLPEEHAQAGLRATPVPASAPRIYVLGATVASARSAALLGLPYVFSLFIGADEDIAVKALREYREHFDASGGAVAEGLLAVAAIAAETDEEALAQLPPQKVVKVHLASGRTVTLGTLEQAEEYGRTSGEAYRIEEKEPVILAGSKETVRARLEALREASGVEEFIVTTNVPDFAKRLRSFELLAEIASEAAAEQSVVVADGTRPLSGSRIG